MSEPKPITDVVKRVRSGVAHLVLERARQRVGSGSGFLIEEGLVTAHHVLFKTTYDTLSASASPTTGLRTGFGSAWRLSTRT